MVDLAKIRKKKAKEKEEKREAQAQSTQQTQSAPAEAEPRAEQPRTPSAESPAALPPDNRAAALPPHSRTAAPPTTDDRQPTTDHGQPPTDTAKLERFKQEAGRRREITEVETQEVEEQTSQLELLTFVIANEQYAVDIERIVEIVTPRHATRIPNADASVVGILSLRGTIVTLLDVRRKLRHPVAGEPTADTRIIVIDYHHEIVGFLVDRVLRVVKTAPTAIEPHPVVHAAELDDSIRGVFRSSGALTILLDLDKLLDHRALAAPSA
ncbi:MAG: chemotaxis protein CheW [Acidobacteriota bacterium]|nr:chemotaxis protein CheW [Acidobacteriota bacterium]